MSTPGSPEETCLLLERCSLAVQRSISEAERNEASRILLQFRRSQSPYQVCLMVLHRASSPSAQHHALTTIKDAMLREWGTTLSPSDALQMGDTLLKYIHDHALSESPALPPFVITQLMHVVVLIHKRNWPVGPLRAAPGILFNGSDLPPPSTASSYDMWNWDNSTAGHSLTPPPAVEVAASAELSSRVQRACGELLSRIRTFFLLPAPEHKELGAIFAQTTVTEFSASHSASLGASIPWEFHVAAHSTFETHGLRELYSSLATTLFSFAPSLSTSSPSNSRVLPSLLRVLTALRAILGFDFDERNSLPEDVRGQAATVARRDGTIRSLLLSSFHTPSLHLREQSLEESMAREEIKPGVVWADILLTSRLLPTLLDLYRAICGILPRVAMDTPASAFTHSSRDAIRCAQAVLDLLLQLGSLSGSIFGGEEAVRNIFPSTLGLILRESAGEREKLVIAATAKQALRDAIAGFNYTIPGSHTPHPGNGLLEGYFSQILDLLTFFADRVEAYPPSARGESEMFIHEVLTISQLLLRAARRFPLVSLLGGGERSILGIFLRFVRVVLTPEVLARHGESSLDTWASEAWEILLQTCTVFCTKRASVSISTTSTASTNTFAASPVGESEYLNSTASSPSSSAYLAPTSLREEGFNRSSHSSTHPLRVVSPDLIQYLEESLLQVLEYYISLRHDLCQMEASADAHHEYENNEQDHGQDIEQDQGNEQFVNNSNTENVLLALAIVARIAPRQALQAMQARIQQTLTRLQSVVGTPMEEDGSLTGEQDFLWFLFQLLLHVLCHFDEAGESPSIPTELMQLSIEHHTKYALSSGLSPGSIFAPSDPVLDAIRPVFEYLGFENSLLLRSFLPDYLHLGSSSNTGVLSSTKSGLLSPYVSRTVLRLLRLWVSCYVSPCESGYASVSPGLLQLVGNEGPFVRFALEELLGKIVTNLLLWGEDDAVSNGTCRLFAQLSAMRILHPALLSHITRINELLTVFKIAYFRDDIELAAQVPLLLQHTCIPSQHAGQRVEVSDSFIVPEVLRRVIEQVITVHINALNPSQAQALRENPGAIQDLQLRLLSTCVRLSLSSLRILQTSLFLLISPTMIGREDQLQSLGSSHEKLSIPVLGLFCELIKPLHARLLALVNHPVICTLRTAMREQEVIFHTAAMYGTESPANISYTVSGAMCELSKHIKTRFSTQDLASFYAQLKITLALLRGILPSMANGATPIFAAFLWKWLCPLLSTWQALRLITSMPDSLFLRLFKKITDSGMFSALASPHLTEYLVYVHGPMMSIFTSLHPDLFRLFSLLQTSGLSTTSVTNSAEFSCGAEMGDWSVMARIIGSEVSPSELFAGIFSRLSIPEDEEDTDFDLGLDADEKEFKSGNGEIELSPAAHLASGVGNDIGGSLGIGNVEEATAGFSPGLLSPSSTFGSELESDDGFANSFYTSSSSSSSSSASASAPVTSRSTRQIQKDFVAHSQRILRDLSLFMGITRQVVADLRTYRVFADDDGELFTLFLRAHSALSKIGIESTIDHAMNTAMVFRPFAFPDTFQEQMRTNPAAFRVPEASYIDQPMRGEPHIHSLAICFSIYTVSFILENILSTHVASTLSASNTRDWNGNQKQEKQLSLSSSIVTSTLATGPARDVLYHLVGSMLDLIQPILLRDLPTLSSSPHSSSASIRAMSCVLFNSFHEETISSTSAPSSTNIFSPTSPCLSSRSRNILAKIMILITQSLTPSFSTVLGGPLGVLYLENATLAHCAASTSPSSPLASFRARATEFITTIAQEHLWMVYTAKELFAAAPLPPPSFSGSENGDKGAMSLEKPQRAVFSRPGAVVQSPAAVAPRVTEVKKLRNYLDATRHTAKDLVALGEGWPSFLRTILPFSASLVSTTVEYLGNIDITLSSQPQPQLQSQSQNTYQHDTSLFTLSFKCAFVQLMNAALFVKLASGNESGDDPAAAAMATSTSISTSLGSNNSCVAALATLGSGCTTQRLLFFVRSLASVIFMGLADVYFEVTSSLAAKALATGQSYPSEQEIHSAFVVSITSLLFLVINEWVDSLPLVQKGLFSTSQVKDLRTIVQQYWFNFCSSIILPPNPTNGAVYSDIGSMPHVYIKFSAFFGRTGEKEKTAFKQALFEHIQSLHAYINIHKR